MNIHAVYLPNRKKTPQKQHLFQKPVWFTLIIGFWSCKLKKKNNKEAVIPTFYLQFCHLFWRGCLLLWGFCCPYAGAYIPSYSLILSQLAESQGKGAYRVEQSVQIKSHQITETWWVEPEGLRLNVRMAPQSGWQDGVHLSDRSPSSKSPQSGWQDGVHLSGRSPSSKSPQSGLKDEKGLSLRFLYKKGKKIFRDKHNKIQSQKVPPYHLEWPFHMRKADKLKKLFALWQMAPLSIPEREQNSPSDPFVKLSRKGGTVQYEISQGKSQLWIEQDEFVIRGWKWPTGESLQAQNYQLYPGRLFFPESRVLHLGATHSVRIKLKKIQKQKPNKQRLSQKWLNKRNHYPENLPDRDIIRAFYEKFR